MGVPKGDRKAESLFKETIAKHVWKRYGHPGERSSKDPNKINPETLAPRHIAIKILNIKAKGEF